MPLGKKINADNFDLVVSGIDNTLTNFARKRTLRKPKKKTKATRKKRGSYHTSHKPKRRYNKSKHSIRRKPVGNTQRHKKRVGKVYYTRKGQPYKIMSSGKARFIKGRRNKR